MEVHIHDTLIFIALHFTLCPCRVLSVYSYAMVCDIKQVLLQTLFITVINPGFNLGQGCPPKQYFFKQHCTV